MSDETDMTSEVARVLNLHASFKASAEIQDPNTPWYWECDGCDTRLVLSGTYGRPEVIAALAAHQAAMLAEAGLLRDYVVNAHESCNRELGNALAMAQEAQIAAQEPAGATQGGSGDSRASGGLDEAPVDPLDVSELLSQVARLEQERDRLENEVHGLEQAKDQWRDSANVAEAQVEAIRAAITREAAHGEAITRCNLVAERFQTVLDSVSAP